MKFYLGHRVNCNGGQPVTVVDFRYDGKILSSRPLYPEASQTILGISPDGFNWSYGRAGPTLLSHAILLDLFGEETALKYYADFIDIVSTWGDKFQVSEQDIKDWITQQKGGVLIQVEKN